MSWKLTRSTSPPRFLRPPPLSPPTHPDPRRVELKETTLGTSLSSSVSPAPAVSNSATKRSSGTITSPSQAATAPAAGDKPSASSSIPSLQPSADAISPTSDSTLKPGRLTVQIFEAKGLTLPPGVNRPPERPSSSSAASVPRGHDRAKPSRSHLALPYIVLEFDKNQVVLETNYGELSAPVWGRTQDLYIPPFHCCLPSSQLSPASPRRFLIP